MGTHLHSTLETVWEPVNMVPPWRKVERDSRGIKPNRLLLSFLSSLFICNVSIESSGHKPLAPLAREQGQWCVRSGFEG